MSVAVSWSRDSTVPPWPCSTATIDGELVDVVGLERVEQRPEPVEQRGEVEPGVGAVEREIEPAVSCCVPLSPGSSARYRWPSRFW